MYQGVFRSRSAEKLHRPEFSSGRVAGAAPGQFQSRSQTNSSRVLHDNAYKGVSAVDERSFGRSSSRKSSGKPIQTLINEELSQEMESKRHSPSLVAKLMGLDTLPPPPHAAHKHQKNAGSGRGICAQVKDHSYQKSNNEDQEFKDIFEVMETGKFKKNKSQATWNAIGSSKECGTDLNFIRKKFIDAERLSTDEALHNSKEFDDALEILHCNKDLFLEILQDRSSLLAKHLHDMNRAPVTSHSSQITVLRSSKADKHRNTEGIKPERKCEGRSHARKEVSRTSRKPKDSINGVIQNSSASPYNGKSETHVHPTRIVVLKPSIGKAQQMIGPVSFSHDNLSFASKKQRESVATAIRELYRGGIDTHKLPENVHHSKYKAKGSREIAGEIARQVRHSHSKRAVSANMKAYGGQESSYNPSDVSVLNNPESYSLSPCIFDESGISPSSSFSTESIVSREARKRMSERWKMTRQFHDAGISANGEMSTLGEMLALSDRQIPTTNVVPLGKKKVSYDKLTGNALLGTWDFPIYSQSKNIWEDGSSRKLRRSKSLPAASTANESPKGSCRKQGDAGNCYMLKDVLNMSPDDISDGYYSKRHKSLLRSTGHYASKSHHLQCVGEENLLPAHEIHVHSEELRKSVHVRILSEENIFDNAFHDEPAPDRVHLPDTSSFPLCESETSTVTTVEENKKQYLMQLTSENENLSNHNDSSNSNKEDLNHHPPMDPPHGGRVISSNECEQPSPVSVLEPPLEEESSSSGCFGRISADLQELRMQLKLLKLESAEREEDEFGVITTSSDEDSAGDSQSVPQTEEKIESFKDEDDRDFSYLLDILIDSDIQGSKEGRPSGGCYTVDHQMDPDVFYKLEKKYSAAKSWSRSERKLLFDLVNSIIVAPCINQQRWGDKGLVEGLWQMVVEQRKDLDFNLEEKILNPRWIGIGEDVEVITEEMEKMLHEDMLDEILAEFIIG